MADGSGAPHTEPSPDKSEEPKDVGGATEVAMSFQMESLALELLMRLLESDWTRCMMVDTSVSDVATA